MKLNNIDYMNKNYGKCVVGYPAFKGAFNGNFSKAEVRIKAWNVQELVAVMFNTSISFSTSQGVF
jgi:hypothetical protein